MTDKSTALKPAAAAPTFKGVSVYGDLKRISTVAEFAAASERAIHQQPALNYPVFRLLNELTDASLMAVIPPRRGGMPIFIASVNAAAEQPEIAVSHVPRPHVRELIAALRNDLKIENATILTTRDTAEGLEKEWGRDGQHTAHMQADSWSWYQIRQPKPAAMDVPPDMAFEILDMPQTAGENPIIRFARLVRAGETQASINMQQLPGIRRLVLGDLRDDSFAGENSIVAPLFNHLLDITGQQKQSIGFILSSNRSGLCSQLLGKHVYNCEATYRKLDVASKGATLR